MISNKLDFEVIRAAFQMAKEFNVIPDDDLAVLGTTRPTVDAWTMNLRSLRAAVRAASPEGGSDVQVVDGNLHFQVPQVGDEQQSSTSFVIEDAQYFQAVSGHLVTLMGDREVFLRTGFEADELRDAALRISELVSSEEVAG